MCIRTEVYNGTRALRTRVMVRTWRCTVRTRTLKTGVLEYMRLRKEKRTYALRLYTVYYRRPFTNTLVTSREWRIYFNLPPAWPLATPSCQMHGAQQRSSYTSYENTTLASRLKYDTRACDRLRYRGLVSSLQSTSHKIYSVPHHEVRQPKLS